MIYQHGHHPSVKQILTALSEFPAESLRDNELQLEVEVVKPEDPSRGWVPTVRFLMRTKCEIVGRIDLRVGKLDVLDLYRGHVGYGVNERFRGNRYAARSVKLICPIAMRLDINPLYITCDPENIASSRTLEIAGGRYLETFSIPESEEMYSEGARFRKRFIFHL